jgi:hypothetical protein
MALTGRMQQRVFGFYSPQIRTKKLGKKKPRVGRAA